MFSVLSTLVCPSDGDVKVTVGPEPVAVVKFQLFVLAMARTLPAMSAAAPGPPVTEMVYYVPLLRSPETSKVSTELALDHTKVPETLLAAQLPDAR